MSDRYVAELLDEACRSWLVLDRQGVEPTEIHVNPVIFDAVYAARRAEVERGNPVLLLGLDMKVDDELPPFATEVVMTRTLTSIDHLGITVPSLDAALDFFQSALDGEIVHRIGPFPARLTSPASPAEPDEFGRHPETRPVEIAMVRIGSTVLEVFEFAAPDQRSDLLRWSDLGSFHIAVRVDDVEQAAARLTAHGAHALGTIKDGPESGMKVLFAQAPWGLIVELLSYAPDSAMAAAMRPTAT